MARLTLISIGLIVISFVFTNMGYAEIDLDACIGAWLFNEGADDIAIDSSGKENDGQSVGAEWADGKFGGALDFNGVDSRVDIPDSDSLNDVKDITMMTWVYLRRGVTSGTWNALAGKNPYTNGYLIWLDISPLQPCPCGLVFSAGARFDNRAPVKLDLETWYHLAFTRASDGGMIFYIDGKSVGLATSAAGPISITPGPITIGGQSPQVVDGLMDEVIFFNTVLSADDINVIMSSGFLGASAISSADKLASTWASVKTTF